MPVGVGEVGVLGQERRLADHQVRAVGERKRCLAEPGVHDEREPLPAPWLAHLGQPHPPAADVEPALPGEFADVRPADPERGEAYREHAAAVRLGQLVAEGRDAV